MRKLLVLALMPFVFASTHENPVLPPGVPERCCGYSNCVKVRVEVLERNAARDVAVVDGKRMVLPPGTVLRSKREGSWWCYQEILDGCHKEISARCARCVVKGDERVAEVTVIPALDSPRGTHLLLPTGDCAKCHGGPGPLTPTLSRHSARTVFGGDPNKRGVGVLIP